MIASKALSQAVASLKGAGVPDAPRDARILLAAALGIEPGRVSLILSDPVPVKVQTVFDHYVTARLKRQPVSQIIGGREFYGRRFIVTPDVLDPRPDTETLVEHALKQPFETVLDLGSGSGCILLTLLAERPAAKGVGADISDGALKIAAQNAENLQAQDRVQLVKSDWFENISGQFDLIVSNPPYIAQSEMADLSPEVRDWEPEIALTPGGDGLDAYRIIAAHAPPYLVPDGVLIVEIGFSQANAVIEVFQKENLRNIEVFPDLNGHDRVILAKNGKKTQV